MRELLLSSEGAIVAGRPPKIRPDGAPDATQRVEAVERALAILDCFDEAAPTLSLSQIASRSGLYPSTALRLCGSLERGHILRRDEAGRYRLGSKIHRLGRLYEHSVPLAAALRPVLQSLADKTGETAAFYTREGRNRLCLFRVNGPRPVRSHLDEGALLPLDRGAAGHVLMAWTGSNLPKHHAIRDEGYSLSRGERDVDSAAIAVPLFRASGEFLGALGLAGPVTRFGDDIVGHLLEALRAAARRVNAQGL